ncbi:growth hormone secretagogue receptor type 1-like [Physella acuta]|uniref:growth hormone secretagogue receptor type 1-like n=1 Tax=Physella acuta TaxID=109671 RepID=UPI0027DAE918|nr:growth hormone secretagogue receptor type 1-like [Physella acuta]
MMNLTDESSSLSDTTAETFNTVVLTTLNTLTVIDQATLTVIDKAELTIIDKSTLTIIDTLFSCVLVNVLAVLGSIGNVINVIVLSHHGFGDSTNILLLAMSSVDLVFLVTSIPKRFVCILSKFDLYQSLVLNSYVTTSIWMPNRFCGLVSSGLVTFISLERFIAVHFPLRVSRIITPGRTLSAVVSLFLFWALLSGPFFALYSIEWMQDPASNLTLPTIVLADFISKDPESFNILNVTLAVIRGPVSVSLIIISSLAISFRLYITTRKMSKGQSLPRSNRDVRVVKMLLVVTSVYAVIGIPLSVPYIMYYVYPESSINPDGTLKNIAILLEIVNDLLYVVNASINFVIYVTMSKKFYNTYRRKFVRCRCVWVFKQLVPMDVL